MRREWIPGRLSTHDTPDGKSDRTVRSTPLVLQNSYRQLAVDDEARFQRSTCGRHVKLMWNGRSCAGLPIHEAVQRGDLEETASILKADSNNVNMRFTYETRFANKLQEGSAEPIHLAASRGHVEIVQLLLNYGAKLDAMVTRNCKPHYDVLHAAVFAEGRGGTEPMCRFLLSANAPISANADGDWPLHKAFQTGSIALVRLLEDEMMYRGVDCSVCVDSERPSPLELGIRMGKMSEQLLAHAAPLTSHSLRVFIQYEQRCIPAFVERALENDSWTAARLAEHVQGEDIANVLRQSQEAACALLDGMTATPLCESEGWWPLPQRVSYAPRSWWEQVRYMVNPLPTILQFYQPDTAWHYNMTEFRAPAWHSALSDRSFGSPILDTEIQVCHVPDLVCAEFFAALAKAEDSGHSGDPSRVSIFKNVVVRGSIAHCWWTGASKVDIVQVFFTLVGLASLILESSLTAQGTMSADQLLVWQGLVRDVIASKGVVDLGQEVLQLLGYRKIGRAFDYMGINNVVDLTACALQVSLFYNNDHRAVKVLVIFIYWARLGNIFMWAENVACALIPIQGLARSLGPASLVTFVYFSAFTHAFYTVSGKGTSFMRDIVPMSFQTLIAADLPGRHKQVTADTDFLELGLTYVAVLVFTIFILNTFIGVIGKQYEVEKDVAPLTFQRKRANVCLNYLLRSRVLPCCLVSRTKAMVCSVLLIVGTILAQGTCMTITGQPLLYTKSVFILTQSLVFLLAFQNESAPWAAPSAEGGVWHHLWLAFPRELSAPSTLDEIGAAVKELQVAFMNRMEDKGSVQSCTTSSILNDVYRRSSSLSVASRSSHHEDRANRSSSDSTFDVQILEKIDLVV